jgi:Mycotoxin biosynthesis protein UstYa
MTTAGPAFSWNIQFPAPVLLDPQNSVNYQMNGSAAEAQWKALIPPGDGIVRLGPDKKPFMLSTFHQLRCLDIIRESYARDMLQKRANPTPLTRHCMNYIRQMVLCRGDLKLERVVDPYGAHSVQIRDPKTCLDWRSLYSQVEANVASTL